MKTWTLEDLLGVIYADFHEELSHARGLSPDKLLANTRLRGYDEKKKAKLTVFSDYNQSLHRLRFNFSTTLVLETKSDEEAFEAYDPDWLFLKAIKFDSNIDEKTD